MCIKKCIKTSVKYGGKQFTKAAKNRYWPVIFWTFLITLVFVDRPYCPFKPRSGNTPELKTKLKNAKYNGIISCAVALIYSFIIPSFEHALLFFKFINTFQNFIFWKMTV